MAKDRDLVATLRPVTFLKDVESQLADQAQTIVSRCKAADSESLVEEAAQAAETLWRRHGEALGQAVAFLWLAEWDWQRGNMPGVLEHCHKALEPLPHYVLAPAYTITKATVFWTIGQAYHASGDAPAASDAYQKALECFETGQAYWRRMGSRKHVKFYNRALKRLKALASQVQADAQPPALPSPTADKRTQAPTRAPAPEYGWIELVHPFVLKQPIPAGAPRDLASLPHYNVEVRQLVIQDKPYLVKPLRKKRRVLLSTGHTYFIVPVRGDSMDLRDIAQDDFVVLEQVESREGLANGDIVAAEVTGEREATLKQYSRKSDGRAFLQARSSNPDWQDYSIEIDGDVWIRGVVVAVLKATDA